MTTLSMTGRHGRADLDGEADFFVEHGWERVPRLVQWFATGRCPLACPHCLAADGREAPDMPLALAGQLIEQIAEMGVFEFLLTGGEPLARPDLPEVIGLLHANRVRWSLNTAVMPDRRAQAAIAACPPAFVAVSLDGPRAVHDAFRGASGAFDAALESMRFFSELGCRVAAGTTVTARNIRHLPATFGIVLASGADEWGLHLLVPEGRAAGRPALALSKRNVRGLIDFVAAKRTWFPVTMADEIGYCGRLEPLVRDAPFYCGAGRSGCVVLPDGEVVPCTTTDRSASAGNIAARPLREIWEDGFAELRRWTPQGRCSGCSYAPACGGGCWLQRRHGNHCFRASWHVPGALQTAAGVAVCLGLAVAAGPAPAQRPVMRGAEAADEAVADAVRMEVLQRNIIRWYASQFGGRAPGTEAVLEELAASLPDDPGARYVLVFAREARGPGIEERARRIRDAFATEQRSLCLVGLAWRDLTEWCLDGTKPGARSPAERQALREATAAISVTAEDWRREILEDRLDPFLRRPLRYRNFFRSKAGPTPEQSIESRIAQARWGGGEAPAETVLEDHPFAKRLDLACRLPGDARLVRLRGGEESEIEGAFALGAFDILRTPAEGTVTLDVVLSDDALDLRRLGVALPPDAELAYGDILRLAATQHREALARLGHRLREMPLAIPVLRERLARSDLPDEEARMLRRMLVDFYLF